MYFAVKFLNNADAIFESAQMPTILHWIIWSFKQEFPEFPFQLNNTQLKSAIGALSVIYYFDEAYHTLRGA